MIPDYRLEPKFPALKFASAAAFDAFAKQEKTLLDQRYSFEMSLPSTSAILVRDGTCAPCLRRAAFTSDAAAGKRLADGRLVPNWREAERCDCDAQLTNRSRAVLHFLLSDVGLSPKTRLIILGPPSEIDYQLAKSIESTRSLSRLAIHESGGLSNYRLDERDASQHLVLCLDYLQHVPPLREALVETHRVLIRGGSFVFTIPFNIQTVASTAQTSDLPRHGGLLPTEVKSSVHQIGWDILDHLRDVGFADAGAYLYWSAELGYLGPFNLIFRATR